MAIPLFFRSHREHSQLVYLQSKPSFVSLCHRGQGPDSNYTVTSLLRLTELLTEKLRNANVKWLTL